ncbi:MAG: CPBP family intramembrane glutamic endopeptidase [Desulfuromonadales bacterium]|nr:CPBP family intramembrane glutamic endopeptidase [Desulfuromonadales bacterium]
MMDNYRYPFRFYFFSAVIPWSLWLMAAYLSHQSGVEEYRGYIVALGLAGLCGPLCVAVYYISKDKVLLGDVASRLLNVRTGEKRYLLASLLLMPASILLAMAISLLFGYDVGQFSITGQASFSSALFPVWFLLIIAPVLEELAWHSYGTDCLRQKFTLLTTSMIFAVYWALWHVPLAFIQGYYHSKLVVEGALHSLNFLISLFPFVLLMNWLYYKTDRNILVAVVLHLTANVFNEIFATHPDSKVIQTGLLLVFSVYLLFADREFFFNRNYPRQSPGPNSRQTQPFMGGEQNV